MRSLIASETGLDSEELEPELQQYLIFKLSEESFALRILNVKEIIEFGHLTEVPRMPASIRGVINLRGAVVPVIDLGARFGKRETEVTDRTCIIILEVQCDGEAHWLGAMVSGVSDVVEISPENIEPAPTFGSQIRADFIEGMGKVDDRFVVILKVDEVLSLDEISVLAGAGNVDAA